MKQTALIILAALIALALGISVRQLSLNADNNEPSPLPEFSLPDLSGHQRHISEWRGKVLVINFWATWCPPCRKEIPDFIALQQRYGDQGVQFIGIALEDQKPVIEYLAEHPINYPILLGGNNGIALARQLGNRVDAVPYTLVVDKQGQIIHRHPGEFDKEQLADMITPLLTLVSQGPKP
ncbi:MAG: TlpA disulfide reductase family protein [Methylobacter sp.]|jgi:thiol-disulfide isomerase/thioredoxin|nr:TlpA disulfide reductase family protein [Methylobacter sp.]